MISTVTATACQGALKNGSGPGFRGPAGPPCPGSGRGPHDARAAAPLKLAPGGWAQARTDVAADPDIRFGALPNGMRYAIERQTVPAGEASVRLRFDAGSLMETDAQQGLAH